jgi:lipopolysaccharide/colanic/teichoic acid biosynthesis glycosyltransferase
MSWASKTLMFKNKGQRPVMSIIKNLLGRTIAPAAYPLMILPLTVAAVIMCLDVGLVFYRHRLSGQFGCVQFGAMRANGNAIPARAMAEDPDAAPGCALTHRSRNDPARSRSRGILHSAWLDGLPFLLRAFAGRRWVTGPRPAIAAKPLRRGEDTDLNGRLNAAPPGLWQAGLHRNTTSSPGHRALPLVCRKLVLLARNGDTIQNRPGATAAAWCGLNIRKTKRC